MIKMPRQNFSFNGFYFIIFFHSILNGSNHIIVKGLKPTDQLQPTGAGPVMLMSTPPYKLIF